MLRALSQKQISIHLHPADVASPVVYKREDGGNKHIRKLLVGDKKRDIVELHLVRFF